MSCGRQSAWNSDPATLIFYFRTGRSAGCLRRSLPRHPVHHITNHGDPPVREVYEYCRSGRSRQFDGSLLGGLILGMAESLTAYGLGAEWSPAIAFLLLILILILKPEGLFGRKGWLS